MSDASDLSGLANLSPYLEMLQKLNLTPQEADLYFHHLGNLMGSGKVMSPSGDISTMLQAVVGGPGGRYYNIPTVWGGQVLTTPEATQRAAQTGWNRWPSYPTPEQADLRYDAMHDFMARDVGDYFESFAPKTLRWPPQR